MALNFPATRPDENDPSQRPEFLKWRISRLEWARDQLPGASTTRSPEQISEAENEVDQVLSEYRRELETLTDVQDEDTQAEV